MDELRITVDRRSQLPIRLVRVVNGYVVDRQRFATLEELQEWESNNPPKAKGGSCGDCKRRKWDRESFF